MCQPGVHQSDQGKEKKKKKPGMVVHAYNPSYLEGRGRRIKVWDCLGLKHETLTEK
jgi:hypothetical protein